jgi:MFS family permease
MRAPGADPTTAATAPLAPTFVVLVVAYTLSQFYRSFLAIVAPELTRDLGLSGAQLAAMSALWAGAFALAQIPIGLALDRVGPRRTVALTMLSAVAGAALFALARGPVAAIAAMGLIGIGCAPVLMGSLMVVGRTMPPARFSTMTALIIGIGSTGNLLAATPLAALMSAIGWRWSLAVVGAATLCAALAVLAVVRDPPPLAAARAEGGVIGGLVEVVALRALWPFLPLALVGYAVILALRGLWVGPYFAEVYGLDPVARGNAVTAMVVAMILGTFAYGPLDRVFGTRKWVVVGGTSLTFSALVALALAPAADVVVSAALLAAVGGFGATYGMLMAHARSLMPDHLLGRGITFMNLLFIGGAGILQPVSGQLVDRLRAAGAPPAEIYGTLFGGFALALAIGVAAYAFTREPRAPRG